MRVIGAALFLLLVAVAPARVDAAQLAEEPGRLVRADDGFTPEAGDEATAETGTQPDPKAEIARLCGLLTAAAEANAVPEEFFIRLIWAESRFDPNAVSPVGAQGIAQFMPYTAKERGLDAPFEPEQALPASASFLKALHDRFGHWGLAAMAYNAGPNRVDGFLGGGFLPSETRNYVYVITGRSAEFWRARRRQAIEDAALELTLNPHPPLVLPEPPVTKPGDPQPIVAGTVSAAAGGVVPHPGAAGEADGARAAVPKARPADLPVPPVDCATLVAELGKGRASPRPPESGGWTPWGAQLAGHANPSIAMRQFSRAQARLPGDLSGRPPVVIARRVPGMGRRAIHAVQLGAPSRTEARALCKRIGSAGLPCVVVRN